MDKLLTHRLRLEPLEPRHADALFDGLRDARLYDFIAEAPPASVEALRGRYERLRAGGGRSPDGAEHWLNWALWCLPEGRYIGYVQATVMVGGAVGAAAGSDVRVAYVLFPDAWNRGYAREAVAAMVAHLIEVYRPLAVRATVDTRNARSIALLEALGFERVGVTEGAEWIHGVLTDEAEYQRRVPR